MHLRIFILTLLLAIFKTASAQQTDSSTLNLQIQISELQQKLSELQLQLSGLSSSHSSGDSSKTVIIINDKKIVVSGDNVQKSLNELSNDSLLLGQGLKIYQNKDSIIVNIGGLKMRVLDDDSTDDSFSSTDIVDNKTDDNDNKKIKMQMFSLRLGINNFLNNGKVNYSPDIPELELNNSKSLNVGIGLVNMRVNLIKHYVRFNAGLLYDINNYRFQTDSKLAARTDSVAFITKEINQNVSKNKLLSTYLMLPVNFQFSTAERSKKAFTMSAGFRVGYMVGAHTKMVLDNKKEKSRDDFNLNPIKYGVTASVGYSWFHLYADYDMSSLFKDKVSPVVTPFQVGIILASYN